MRTLVRAEDELGATVNWTRVFPSKVSHQYLDLLEAPSYTDRLLDAWETRVGADRREGRSEKRQEGKRARAAEREKEQAPSKPRGMAWSR